MADCSAWWLRRPDPRLYTPATGGLSSSLYTRDEVDESFYSLCRDAWQLREVRFRLLTATGRMAEAAAVFDRANDRWVPLVLARARVPERLGDRSTAIRWYRFAADAWRHADPELQPIVAEARTALERLSL